MNVKFLFKVVRIENDRNIDIEYIPSVGTIIDKNNNNNVLYKLPITELKPFFYFKLEFDNYQYESIYQPKTDSYKDILMKRIYHLYLYLNIKALLSDRQSSIIMYNLMYYVAQLQINEIIESKKYTIKSDNIDGFINYRESQLMYFIGCRYFRLNSKYVFDFDKRDIIDSRFVNKINFNKKGGIIESNNVKKLIHDRFTNGTNLIIIPGNMTDLWSETNKKNIITYDKLLQLKKSDISFLNKTRWSRIIIHECHSQFIVGIKYLLTNINCGVIWIINSLPLKYYLASNNSPDCSQNMVDDKSLHLNKNSQHKIGVSDIASFINIWLGFDINHKKLFRNEIIRFILTKFNQIYTKVSYPNSIKQTCNLYPSLVYSSMEKTKQHRNVNISLSPFEKSIYDQFKYYLDNWKNKLTNNSDNVYSIATEKKIRRIENKIYHAVITLILSITNQEQLSDSFTQKINNGINIFNFIMNKNDELIKKYSLLNQYINFNTFIPEQNISILKMLESLIERKKTLQSKIINYTRYMNHDYQHFLKDKTCPVCYSTDELPTVVLICGHNICLECIINSMTHANECPVCREFVTIEKMTIVKETIQNPQSNITNYFKQLGADCVVITNICAFNNINSNPKYQANVININKHNIMEKIRNMDNIKKIIILTMPNRCDSKIDHIVGYFKSFNNPPIIRYVNIDFFS
jgi:hypothetical protein